MGQASHGVLESLGSEVREVQGRIATLRRQQQRCAAELGPPAERRTDLVEGAQTEAAGQHDDLLWFRLAARNRALAEALARLQEGAYGICQNCEGRIPRRRLEALPTATLCVACQERREASQAT
jgi:DnaK suppressor protein